MFRGKYILTYLTVDGTYTERFIQEASNVDIEERIQKAHEQLINQTGPGSDFLGWHDYPVTFNKAEIQRIQLVAEEIKEHSDVFIVIGVGGSYLGARAAIELLSHTFQNELPQTKRRVPQIIYAGHHFSGAYMNDLFDFLEGRDFSINVISKSGSTLETAIAFRLIKQEMEKRYDKDELQKRIFITTDEHTGPLKKIADQNQFESFTIPDEIGGRYSVLTAVGLLPMAVSGIDIEEILQGAKLAFEQLQSAKIEKNDSYYYAALRTLLYENGKKIELLSTYEPRWHYFQEWWKQLFGESEGKNNQGLFPTSISYSTDLHSLGQYIQEGERHLFQTIIFPKSIDRDVTVLPDENDTPFLEYLSNRNLHEINYHAFKGALEAHHSGKVPNIVVHIPDVTAFTFGYLVYFFQKSCAISSYVQQVNPFNQPGVEAYKNNMMALLQNK